MDLILWTSGIGLHHLRCGCLHLFTYLGTGHSGHNEHHLNDIPRNTILSICFLFMLVVTDCSWHCCTTPQNDQQLAHLMAESLVNICAQWLHAWQILKPRWATTRFHTHTHTKCTYACICIYAFRTSKLYVVLNFHVYMYMFIYADTEEVCACIVKTSMLCVSLWMWKMYTF